MTPDLETILKALAANDMDDPSLYNFLWKVDEKRFNTLLKRLERVENAKKPAGQRGWSSRQGDLKGRVYEELVEVALKGAKCFHTWSRVISSTNELDILVELG